MSSLTLSGPFDTSQLPRIADEPVTLTVSRTVRPGFERQFLDWADETIRIVSKFQGSLGAAVLSPGPDGGDFQVIFRFTDGLHLRLWERSPQRSALMAQAAPFVLAERVHRTVGVENWFELPARAEPSRSLWKRIVTDVLWIYPVSLLVSLVVAPALVSMPIVLRVLVSAVVITLAVRLAVGPLRSRLRSRRTF